jgi:hypothetical protein
MEHVSLSKLRNGTLFSSSPTQWLESVTVPTSIVQVEGLIELQSFEVDGLLKLQSLNLIEQLTVDGIGSFVFCELS